ncbi:MAG TPA: hypothetical protein VGF67_05555 [Ktedonobacteraceae bacterium]|jgi:hypothetical protein
MAILITSKQLEKKKIARKSTRSPASRRRHALKKRLLTILVSSLILLSLFSLLLTSAQILRPQALTCGEFLRTANYPRAVHLQAAQQEMVAVQLIDHLVGTSQTALVQVTNLAGPRALDVYVFGCIIRHRQFWLTRLFTRQGLVQGRVEATPEHTLITTALDTRLPAGLFPFLQPQQQNVYCEYAWQQHGFAQIPFPGFYPVTSRAEAGALQHSADSGEYLPWGDAATTALQMSKDLLHWSSTSQAQTLARTADTVVVALTRQRPRVTLVVTLKQLSGHHRSALWFVTDARTRGILLSAAGTLDRPLAIAQRSPIHLLGASALVDGQTTTTLFDHTLTPIHRATDVSLHVHQDSRYAGTLSYTHLASGQQGVLLIESMPRARNATREAGQLLLRAVILS